jgi:hypothetical protein
MREQWGTIGMDAWNQGGNPPIITRRGACLEGRADARCPVKRAARDDGAGRFRVKV